MSFIYHLTLEMKHTEMGGQLDVIHLSGALMPILQIRLLSAEEV